MNNFGEVIDLIKHFDVYKVSNPTGNLENFGAWLHQKISMQQSEEEAEEALSPQNKELTYYYKEKEKEIQIGILLSRMPRYARFYVKKGYGEKFNISIDEFGFLAGARNMQSPTKSELINANLNEITTGTEILKRLIRMGYLEEIANEEDKRSKRVRLTPKGNEVLDIALIQMEKITKLISANLSEAQKDELVKTLIQLDEFHVQNFFHSKELDLDDLVAML